MTRETKLGLVVASSFVALTTIVVVSRLKQGREPAPTPDNPQQVASAPPVNQGQGSPGRGAPAGTGAIQDPDQPKILPLVANEKVPIVENHAPNPPQQMPGNGLGSQGSPTPPPTPGPSDGLPGFDGLPSAAAPKPANTVKPSQPPVAAIPSPENAGIAPAPGFPTVEPNETVANTVQPNVPPQNGKPAKGGWSFINDLVEQKPEQVALANPANPPAPIPPSSGAKQTPTGNNGLPMPQPVTPPSNPALPSDLPGMPEGKSAPTPANPLPDAKNGGTMPTPPGLPGAGAASGMPDLPGLTPAPAPAAPAPTPAPVAPLPKNPDPAAPGLDTNRTAVSPPGGIPLPDKGTAAPTPPTPGATPPLPNAPGAMANPGAAPVSPLPQPSGPKQPALLTKKAEAPGTGMPSANPAPSGLEVPAKNDAVGIPNVASGPVPAPAVPVVPPGAPVPAATPSAPPRVAQLSDKQREAAMNIGAAPVPAVGAQPRAVTSPVKVDPVPETPRSAPNAQSEVKVYDSRVVACSAQDTSFAVLSDRYYNSPNYAQALQRYNQEYPTAADEVKTNPPQLRTGTPIQIPPKDILELRYPELFSRSNAGQTSSRREPFSAGKPVPAPRNEPPPVAVSQPRPAQTASATTQDRVPAPSQEASASAGGTGSNPRYYRVASGGEQLYEIAQRQLGSSSRWPEIYQKNPTVEPGLVPAGTVLVLPQ